VSLERSLIEAAARLRRQREPHLVGTVIRTHGAGYRSAGTRMLLTQFRWHTGSATGGALAGELAHRAWSSTRGDAPLVVRLDDVEDIELRAAFGLGQQIAVDVMFERGYQPGRIDPMVLAERCLREQRCGAVATVIASEHGGIRIGARVALCPGEEPIDDGIPVELVRAAMVADAHAAAEAGSAALRTYTVEGGSVEVFVEPIVPPARLFVFGTGHDLVPLVELARGLGWDTVVCAPQLRDATRERFHRADALLAGELDELAAHVNASDRAIAVVLSHDDTLDRGCVAMLAQTRARYIGVPGPLGRTQALLAAVAPDVATDSRVRTPGTCAETPPALALALLADIQATVLERPAAHGHRDRPGATGERPMPRIAEALAAASPV
jgi:xanthine dehydrogenase accessory factor